MKILKLRFNNLNSLYGQWEIDFTSPEYINSGIFAIVGATGAGKSTILDAISLALYGRTPRLSTVSVSTNEVMSRGTGECSAEVFFEVSGVCYSVHWSQRRARGKASGKLQGNKHKLDDITNSKSIAEKVNQTKAKIEEITGMHFDQFTRSMLLAQGEFSKFLKASTNERSEILEKITDTVDYSRISIAVHELKREEDNKLNQLQVGLDGVSLLDDHEIGELKDKLVCFEKKDLSLKAEEESLRTIKGIYERINELEEERGYLEKEEIALTKSKDEFAEDFKLMQNAQKVEANWKEYKALVELRELHEQEVKNLHELEMKLPVLEKELSGIESEKLEAQQQLEEIKKNFDNELSVIKSVREIDSKITVERKQLQEVDSQIYEHKKYIDKVADDVFKLEKKISSFDNETERVKLYLSNNSVDEVLSNELELILENLRRIYKDKKNLVNHEDELRQLEVVNEKLIERSDVVLKEKNMILKESEELQVRIGALNAERRKLLDIKTLEEVESEFNVAKSRLELVVQLQNTLKERTEHEALIQSYRDRIKSSTLDAKEYRERIGKFNTQMIELEREVEHLELELRMLDKIKTLTQRRDELVDGKPCPLCGALEHPFVSEGLPNDSSLEDKVLAAKSLMQEIRSEITRCNEALVKCETCIDSDNELVRSSLNKLHDYNTMINSVSFELGVDSKGDLDIVVMVEYESLSLEISKFERVLGGVKAVDVEIAEVSAVLGRCKDRLLEQEKIAGEFVAECRAAESKIDNIRKYIIRYKANISDLASDTFQLLSKYGEFDYSQIEDEQEIIANKLKSRVKLYAESNELYEKLSRDKGEATVRYNELVAGLDRERERLKQLDAQLCTTSDSLQLKVNDRCKLYAQKDCDREEQRFRLLITDKEKVLSNLLIRFSAIGNSVAECRAKVESLNTSVVKGQDSLEQKEDDFKQCLHELGGFNEEIFVSSKLDSELLKNLVTKNAELENSLRSIDQRKKINSHEIEKLTCGVDNVEPYVTICDKLEVASLARGDIVQKIGAVKNTLDSNDSAEKIFSLKKKEILSQKNICRKWGDLHELIGSADGKKYRNFAQGLTFDIMLKYANYELSRMSDRYLLGRTKVRPGALSELLEIDVIDKDQAGEVRSAKNLSGGESFIVSLALALGLSRMSSRKIEVCSLFLDEGFGTLDEDELDKVLSALSRIQQQGKLIGVISHVSALKERIGVQIAVEKGAGGKSKLLGAGCRSIK